MKKLLIAAMLLASTSAFAADASTTATAPAAKHVAAKSFDDAKAERLKHINDHLALLQKAQTCVQAAADFNAMKACNTFHGGKGHGWHHHHGARGGSDQTAPANSQ